MPETVYVCCRCSKQYDEPNNFYKASTSSMYASYGYLPICKSCLNNLYLYYVDLYGDEDIAMQRLCMAFDLYFNPVLFDSCDGSIDKIIGNYLRKLNISQYRDKNFESTIKDGFVFGFSNNIVSKQKLEQQRQKTVKERREKESINSADEVFWGTGLSKPDYNILNAHYKELKDANPNCDSNQEIFIKDLCYKKMFQMRAIKEQRSDDYSKLADSYIKSFQQAGLKTVKNTNEAEDFTMGINIETIEKYTPAEYYKDKSLYKDYDKLGEYIKRFMLRPLRNLQYGFKDRDEEYYVKDEEEIDEYSADE